LQHHVEAHAVFVGESRLNVQLVGSYQPSIMAVAIAPHVREGIGFAQLIAGREEKEGGAGAMRSTNLAQCIHHRLRAVRIGRNSKHAKTVPPEMPLMLLAGVRGEICAHLPLKARLCDVSTSSRRIAIYGDGSNGHKWIDVSLKHFAAEDIRRLMRAIHEQRPDLSMPKNWI
jgi:hypothetical protein